MSQPSFSQLVTKAVLQQGPDRQQAEQELIQQRVNDYKQYMIECVKIIVDPQYPGELRQSAGTLIKASATLMNNGKLNWDLVDEGIQNHAKNALLNILVDQDPLARKAAVDAISTICSIELPRNKWTELIESLSKNAGNDDVNIRKTAISTMGFICEKLKDSQQGGNVFQLSDSVLEHILMGIITGTKPEQTDIQVKMISLQALKNALGYLEVYLNKQEVRDFVLRQILDCSVNQDDDIKKESLQTLIEFCKFQYHNLANSIQQIFNVTQNHLTCKDEDIAQPAIELWNTIATEFKDREDRNQQVQAKVNNQQIFNQNYCLMVKEQLIQYLLQNLLIKSDNEDEFESPIQISSEAALCAIVDAVGDSVLEIFQTFISNTAGNQDWAYKQASCLAFGSILECGSDQKVKAMLTSGLSVFVAMLKEQNPFLVTTAAKFLSKAADNYPEVFLRHPNLQADLSTIITTLQQKPEISRHICWIICFISEALKSNSDSPMCVSIPQVIEALMKNALRTDLNNIKDLSLIDCSFMGIMNLLHNSPNPSIAGTYLQHAIGYFKQSQNEPSPKRENIQSGILATLHASLLSIQDQIGEDNSQQTEQMIQTIYDLIINHFQVKKDVDSDGLYVISALATCIKGKFSKYLDGVYPFITHALQKQIDGDLFKTAIGALADISRACDRDFVKHVSIIQTLLQCVTLQGFDRDLKLHVYVCLGDIILACKEASAQYLGELQKTFDLGFTATALMLGQQDQSDIEYAEQLQERLVEAYTCMLHGINNENSNDNLIPGFQNLFNFLQISCDTKHNPTIEYVRNALTLIIDIANFYGNKVANLVKTPFTITLMNILQNHSNIPENAQMLQYAQKIYQAL